MAALPTELEFPPIMSIVLTFLTLLLLIQNGIKMIPHFSIKEIGDGDGSSDFDHIDLSSWSCDKIRALLIEEQFPTDFMYKLSKENLADSLKKLIYCKILDFEKDKKFFNQFSEWENFYWKHPETFEEIGSLMKFEEMTSAALKSLPVHFILKKLDRIDIDLIKKLPIKKILNYLLAAENNSEFWKLFNEQVFNEISSEECNLLMKYLNNVAAIITSDEDVILLLLRTENFLISLLMSLKEGKLWNEDEDDWIERFYHVEMILEKYLEIRKKLITRKDISDIARSLIDSPISNKLKNAIKDVFVKKATPASVLSNVLLMPKPFDQNIQTGESRIKNLSVPLIKFYKISNLLGSSETWSFEILTSNPLLLLDFLRSFSDDPVYILGVLDSVHVFDLVYTEKFPVCEWVKKALELGSPALLNFFYLNYKKLFKSEMAEIFEEAKKEEMIKNIWHFFIDSEMEMELKFLLLIPSGRLETILYLDFVNHTARDDGDITNNTDNSHLKFLIEAYNFYLKEGKGLHQKRLTVKFNEMNGQDTGGLSRHFLMTIFRILVDEKFGLFHSLNSGKVAPRTLLDSSVLGFVGMLHGQALKSSLKVPWLIDFDLKNQPIRLCDLINELARNSEGYLVPRCDSIVSYLNDQYRLFHDRFDFSMIPGLVIIDPEYLNTIEAIEQEFWRAGEEAYKWNLLSSVDEDIANHVDRGVVYEEILKLIEPLKSSEIDSNEFLNCLKFTGEAKDLIKSVFEAAIKTDPQEMIPAILNFVSGSIELPPAGLASLHLVVNTFLDDEKRLPQASTCHKIINWTISSEESKEELMERLRIALRDTEGFELE